MCEIFHVKTIDAENCTFAAILSDIFYSICYPLFFPNTRNTCRVHFLPKRPQKTQMILSLFYLPSAFRKQATKKLNIYHSKEEEKGKESPKTLSFFHCSWKPYRCFNRRADENATSQRFSKGAGGYGARAERNGGNVHHQSRRGRKTTRKRCLE